MIFEPTGASFGMVPLAPDYLRAVRELATRHGVVLIFDEVVTGFRVSPGGAQQEYGVTPDLTTLAKILAGGLPGGALVGKREILDLLDRSDENTSELQSLMRNSYAVFCLKKKIHRQNNRTNTNN